MVVGIVLMRKGEPMIRVNDDWVIDVDDHNYILKKDLHKTVKSKDGKSMIPAYKTIGYFSSPARALDRLGEEIIRDKLSEPMAGLREVAEAIREARAEWRELVRMVTEDNTHD